MPIEVHETAVVDPHAELGQNVQIGPHCVVGPHVRLGADCSLRSGVLITGHTTIGPGNVFFHGCAIGETPQDLKYRGEPTTLVIGEANTFREHVTAHIGTGVAGGVTRIGNGNLFMCSAHVAHDCVVEDRCILANLVQLAGHVHICTGVVIGGLVGVNQFVTVGRCSYVTGGSNVRKDVPPFVIADGDPCHPRAINDEGMKRQGFDADQREAARRAFRLLYAQRAIARGVEVARTQIEADGPAAELVDFLAQRLNVPGGRLLETMRNDQSEDRSRFYRQEQTASPQ